MPATFSRAVIDRAEELWTVEGSSPPEIIEQLEIDKLNGKIGEDVRIPGFSSRSVIYDWAKRYKWSPHWKDAKEQLQTTNGNGPPRYSVSGIDDPIWHLSKVKAINLVPEFIGNQPGWSDDQILIGIQLDIAHELDPGPRVHRELRPIIRREMKRIHVRRKGCIEIRRRRLVVKSAEKLSAHATSRRDESERPPSPALSSEAVAG